MKRTVALLLSIVLSLTFCSVSCAEEDKPAGRTIEKGSLPMYLEAAGTEPLVEAFPVYYADGVNDLPFVEIENAVGIVNFLISQMNPENPKLIAEPDGEGGTAVINLEGNDSFLWFDFNEQTATYTDFDTFMNPGDILIDVLASGGFNEESGEPELFRRDPNTMMQRNGSPVTIRMNEYSIPMIHQDGQFLLPLHTAFVLLLDVPARGGLITCVSPNGIFIGSASMFGDLRQGALSELGELYYADAAGERSETLAGYGFGEFCMEMDCFYGLKEAHGISSFAQMIVNGGLLEEFTGTDPIMADKALAKVLNYYLDDGHSGYNANSPWTGTGPDDNPMNLEGGFFTNADYTAMKALKASREAHEDMAKPYLEIGNTAYICQDEFAVGRDPAEYYSREITEEDIAEDTIALIIYAHRQITRENSPIENVVVDLSCNGGGQVDAAVFMLCWFLGEAPFSVASPVTGAQCTAFYRADINLDHEFDEKDKLTGKNLYCLTSPVSFSCGNLVPWIYKTSGRVTLLGDTTGGGSCIVMSMSSAWGSLYQISGALRVSSGKNGSFYDTDRGVDPDVFLTKPDSFCDREKLTEIINGLY